MPSSILLDRPLLELAAALRAGDTSAAALLDEAHVRHDTLGTALNAYLTWAPESARQGAAAADAAFAAGNDLGPLQGMPVSFKDLYGIQGLPTYGGSSKRLPAKWEREGPVVRDARRQLPVITGKTHTVEFAASGVGDNIHWGAPRNPWDAEQTRGTGGSSSGAGVSLWEGSAKVAFGSDTMGSVRIPGAMSGAVGLKITVGRWSSHGIVPLRRKQDTPGPLTLSVADAAYVFAALDPAHRNAATTFLEKLAGAEMSQFRIGVADDCFWEDCDSGVAEAVRSALEEMERAGATLRRTPSAETKELFAALMSGNLIDVELFAFLENELPEWLDQLEPRLQARREQAGEVSALDAVKRELWLEHLVVTASSCFADVDVIVSPTVPRTPQILLDGQPLQGQSDPPPIINARNTCPANFFGWCAITLPIGFDAENMPVGLQLMAPGDAEEMLLAVASAAEQVLGSARERLGAPPMLV